jgi:hypothetical protein
LEAGKAATEAAESASKVGILIVRGIRYGGR